MKNIKVRLILLLLGPGMMELHAQEAISASGGDASGSVGSVSYSVGQVVYTTNTGTTGFVAQGVQQPYEISVVTSLEKVDGINLVLTAYPNPTNDFLTIKIENYNTERLVYKLYDATGKLIKNKKTEGKETTISMENIVPAIYFMKITDNNKEVKTFKIIKN